MEDKTVLLYSGGLDSWLIRALNKDKINVCLYVNLGTKYTQYEMQGLPNDVVVETLDLHTYLNPVRDLIPPRNLYLCMIASYHGNRIWLGQVSGDESTDKCKEFYSLCSKTLENIYKDTGHSLHYIHHGNGISITAPYATHSKRTLLAEYIEKGGDIDQAMREVRSCYNASNNVPCKHCKACFRNWVAFYLNGIDTYIDKDYVISKVVPLMRTPNKISGKYFTDRTSSEYIDMIQALQLKFNISL